MSIEKKMVRVGIVGVKQGETHLKNIIASGLASRIAVCDCDTERLHLICDKYHIPVDARYTSFDAMLEQENLDAVSVTTPNYLHAPMAIQALQMGVNVLVEKPMTILPEDAEKMCAEAKKQNKILSVNFNQRFMKPVRAAKRLFDEDMLGEIYFVTTHWHRSRGVPWWYPLENANVSCGGGPLIDLGVHVLDRALYICGYPKIVEVMGHTVLGVSDKDGKAHGIGKFSVEDFGAAMLRTETGALFELEASWASNREEEYIETRIYGTKGGILLRQVLGDSGYEENSFFIAGEEEVIKKELSEYYPEDDTNVNKAFLQSVVGEIAPVCLSEDGLAACKILNAVYESAKKKCTVKIFDKK